MRQALGIGYERLAGELAGGIAAWRAAGRVLTSTRLVGARGPRRGRPSTCARPRSIAPATHLARAISNSARWLARESGGARRGDPHVRALREGNGRGEPHSMNAASLMERDGRVAAVVLGGPDDWAAATVRRLETGA